MFKRFVFGLVDASRTVPRALFVVFLSLCALGGAWWYALSHFELHSDIRELLPRDSPGFKAFEHQLGRVGGGATLIVIAESPDRAHNERFVDDLAARLRAMAEEQKARGGPQLVAYVESG